PRRGDHIRRSSSTGDLSFPKRISWLRTSLHSVFLSQESHHQPVLNRLYLPPEGDGCALRTLLPSRDEHAKLPPSPAQERVLTGQSCLALFPRLSWRVRPASNSCRPANG